MVDRLSHMDRATLHVHWSLISFFMRLDCHSRNVRCCIWRWTDGCVDLVNCTGWVYFWSYPNFLITQCRIGQSKSPCQKNQLNPFSHFSRTPTCDRHRHTDRQTHSIYRASIESCSKNVNEYLYSPYCLFYWLGNTKGYQSAQYLLQLSLVIFRATQPNVEILQKKVQLNRNGK